MNEQDKVKENINLLLKKFKSIAEITVNFDRYDLILYNYEEIGDITKFIEEKTDIESWTALKTRVSPDIDTILY
ncbi:MAG: hypothetical protein QMD61_04780 [Methanobacterium sp.]|nr:hypothetical protein [Methanobacterium sp.]